MRTAEDFTDRMTERVAHAGDDGATRPTQGRGPRRVWAFILVAALVAASVAGGAVFAWQNAKVHDRDAALVAANADLTTARADATALSQQVQRLNHKLQAAIEAGKAGQKDVAELRALVGPALPNGRYFGALYAVGATQAPPRLVIDLEQFFTGAAADQAAKEDGVLPPGEVHIPNDVYIRNENPQWRMVQIDPATKVSLVTSPYGQIDAPRVVTLNRFGILYNSSEDQSLQWFPYWITVKHGEIVAIDEQYMP